MQRHASRVVLTGLFVLGCGEGGSARDAGAPDATPAVVLVHDFPEFTVASGEEVLGVCQSWTLDNDVDLLVQAVEMEQDAAYHHTNIYFVPESELQGPDGVWPCGDRGFSHVAALNLGGLLYAQSFDVASEVQTLAPGVVIRVPAHSRLVGDVHLMNTTVSSVTGHLRLGLRLIEQSAVTETVQPFVLGYHNLDIPPHAKARFFTNCDFTGALGGTIDARIQYITVASKGLGTRIFVEVVGGPMDGTSIVDVSGPIPGVPRGTTFDPALELTDATGFRFGCEYQNPRDTAVGWGFGDQEKCEIHGFMTAPFWLMGEVGVSSVPVGMDGDTLLFTAPCDANAVLR